MGLRGGSTEVTVVQRSKAKVRVVIPWEKKGLSRSGRVIAFCEDLTISSGKEAGSKLRLREFQRKFIRDVYVENTSQRRPVRTAVLTMGRKNGKTQASIFFRILCRLLRTEIEERGEVYSCANDRFQASKVFNEMAAMVRRNKYLHLRCVIGRFHHKIEDMENESIYQAVSAEAKTKMGLNPSLVVYDS